MRSKPLLAGVALACVLAARGSITVVCAPQDDLRGRVSQAVNRPFPREAESTRQQLAALGAPALPFIIENIRANASLTPIKKAFLVDVIAGMNGSQSAATLISLLDDPDPYVRGMAASYLGKRRLKDAVPHLVGLLNDKEVYKTVVRTDPAAEEDILVRDIALEALRATTRIALARRSSKDEQAKAWLHWWQRQQRSNRGY